MIDVYSWPTPNGHKVHIMLEECGLKYRVHGVNIRTGEQFTPGFLRISPNNRIPAIVDSDGPNGKPLSLFETGAILIYLAGKTGKFLPLDLHERYTALQWLMWQMGGIGPMFGQANHFRAYAVEKITYAIERYTNEANRLTGVLDRRLGEVEYVAGDYSIADIAIWPWISRFAWQRVEFAEHPNVMRWYRAIAERPAVKRGWDVLKEGRAIPMP
jgi:GST-like protein